MLWDLSSLALGQLLSIALSFAAFAYLARTLSPASYGLIEYAVGLAGLAAIVIEGGTGTIGAVRVASDPGCAGELAPRVTMARLLLVLVAAPLVGLSGYLAGAGGDVAALTWLFAISLLAVPFRHDWLLQGLDRMAHVAPAQAVRSAAFMIGVILVVRGPDQFVTVGLVEIAAAALYAGYFLIAYRALSLPVVLDLRVGRAWPLIREGAAIGATNLIWPFMAAAPIFLLTRVAGSAEAAWLGAAQRIVIALVSFSAIYFFNLYPVMARGVSDGGAKWQQLMGSSYRVIAWSSIGFALAMTLSADAIVTLAFGQPFDTAAPVLALYAWVLPLRLLSGHARWTLLAAGRQRALLTSELVCAIVLVALGMVLVPQYGASGAAVAVLAGNVIGWSAAHRYVERYVGPLPGLRPLVLPAAAAVLGAALARLAGHPAAGVAVAVLVYAAAMRIAAPGLMNDAVRLAYAKKTTSASTSDIAGP